MDTSILVMGIFLGGIVQKLAVVLEYKKANTFVMTAFCSYGDFWLTLVFILIAGPYLQEPMGLEASNNGPAFYLFLWGVYTLLLFFGTLGVNRALQFTFLTLIALFRLLAIGFGWGNETVIKAAGAVGIFTGASSVYLSIAELLNKMFDRVILPIGPAGAETYKRPEDLWVIWSP